MSAEIQSRREHRRALKEIEGLMDARRGTKRGKRLGRLVRLVDKWECIHCSVGPVHPGAILRDELGASDLTANRLALDLGVPSGRIAAILNGRRALTPDTALRLGRYFAMPARFWVDLQAQYDLAMAEQKYGKRIAAEVRKAAA